MSTERKGIEVYVGLFLFVGMATIAAMVVVFGRVGEGFQKTYPLVVEFPNASGLIKDSYVLMSGAQIGKVATTEGRRCVRAHEKARKSGLGSLGFLRPSGFLRALGIT